MWEVLHGDCVEVMGSLRAESVDAVITSPPYAMQRKATYGGIPEVDYPAWSVAWMEAVRRVLKPNGSVVINIRPNVRNGQISDYTLRTRLALRDAGWAEIEELIWHKPTSAPMGHAKRPRRAWESLHWFAKHGRPFCDAKAAGHPVKLPGLQSAGRGGPHIAKLQGFSLDAGTVARVTDVASFPPYTGRDSPDHPAPYPAALAEWVCKLVCPPGGTILDPFNGSASTGVAAIRNGWDYIGIDAVAEYVELSRRRLADMAGVAV